MDYIISILDEENHLSNIFWADSTSRMDYSCFVDVLVFDLTYKTNTYKMPFIIFVGINHHYSTTVFGCALVADETSDNYEWVLNVFLHAMGEKVKNSNY